MQRIESILEATKEQMLTRIKCSPKFTFQIDESTDVTGLPQMLL
jgi:hypothetical protein